VAYGVAASDVPGLITASQSAGVKFLIALVEAPTNVAEMKKAAKAVAAAPAHLQVTLLATPEIVDGAEGSAAYRVGPAIDLSLLAAKTIPRDEILRLLTECFSLPSTAGKALSFYGVPSDDDAAKYLKTLRSKGFSRTMEVNEMIGGGFENAEKVSWRGEREGVERWFSDNISRVPIVKHEDQSPPPFPYCLPTLR